MERPTEEITAVVKALTEGTPQQQERALLDFFLPDAYFIHPFCRVPSFAWHGRHVPGFPALELNSRTLTLMVYKWYRVLSPTIRLEVDSVSLDARRDLLYLSMRQTFTLWVVPRALWRAADVKLVTVLELARRPLPSASSSSSSTTATTTTTRTSNSSSSSSSSTVGGDGDDDERVRYFIRGQEDHYQPDQFLRFVAPWGVAPLLWRAWQLLATLVCVAGVLAFAPLFGLTHRLLGVPAAPVPAAIPAPRAARPQPQQPGAGGGDDGSVKRE
ncbi:hypothetical protein GGR56DRAFT_672976 [Xylariaceae sp. FL0804]|nr:hypothetical protein GGR56DRAFT_672976 [Xylariaceae sp. FL0804]